MGEGYMETQPSPSQDSIGAMRMVDQPKMASAEQQPEVIKQLARNLFPDAEVDQLVVSLANNDTMAIQAFISSIDQELDQVQLSISQASDPNASTEQSMRLNRLEQKKNDLENLKDLIMNPKLV